MGGSEGLDVLQTLDFGCIEHMDPSIGTLCRTGIELLMEMMRRRLIIPPEIKRAGYSEILIPSETCK